MNVATGPVFAKRITVNLVNPFLQMTTTALNTGSSLAVRLRYLTGRCACIQKPITYIRSAQYRLKNSVVFPCYHRNSVRSLPCEDDIVRSRTLMDATIERKTGLKSA